MNEVSPKFLCFLCSEEIKENKFILSPAYLEDNHHYVLLTVCPKCDENEELIKNIIKDFY